MCPASEESVSQPGARVLYGREDAGNAQIRLLGKYLVGQARSLNIFAGAVEIQVQ